MPAGSATSVVYVNESCMECERVRAACERLGAVAATPRPEALPPPLPPPAPPSYLVTNPFDGELFDAAHRAKYRSEVYIYLVPCFSLTRSSPSVFCFFPNRGTLVQVSLVPSDHPNYWIGETDHFWIS